MGNQYSEDLFRSIDTIVSARIEKLPYDQTLIGYISDVSQKDEGIYKAKYESLEVIAYSENTDYQLGDQVYISVPRADYSQKKIILGRIPQDKEQLVKVRPFENYTPCTPNFNEINREVQIIANSSTSARELFTYTFAPDRSYHRYAGYDSLGLKVNLSINLENHLYKAVKGDYYIEIIVRGFNQSTTKNSADAMIGQNKLDEPLVFTLGLDDIATINYYNSYGFCNQEKVFDIKNFLVRDFTVRLVQKQNFVTEDGTLIPEDQKLSITCKDVEITFGYKGKPADFEKGKLFIYTPDGLLYDSKEANSKQFYSRLIILDGSAIQEFNPPNSYPQIRWYKYSEKTDEYIGILGSSSYVLLEGVAGYSPTISTQDGATHRTQLYRLVISKNGYDWLVSDPLTLTNGIDLTNSEILDTITGFQVMATGENDGVFNIYGQDNLLLNDAESFKTHKLRLSYSATASDRALRAGDIIKWKIPDTKTMLKPALDVLGRPIEGVVLTDEDIDDQGSYLLPFKIKNLYNPTFTNNTIQCELTLVEDSGVNTVLTYNKELLFGTSGSSGNDYILTLELCENRPEEEQKISVPAVLELGTDDDYRSAYKIVPHLYNYSMNEISTDDITISYGWLNGSSWNGKDFNNITKIPAGQRIVEATISSLGITGYLPIATKYNESCEYIEGCKTIIYDITGKKPIYYKFENKIKPAQEEKTIVWELYYYESGVKTQITEELQKSLPILKNNIVIPPSIYSSQTNNIFSECKIDGVLAWVQPILITKNKYPSAMFNAELNQSKIGNWFVEQTMVGQINEDGGLVLGHLRDEANNENFGLIGLKKDGAQMKDFFHVFMPDGEVYIANGSGTIEHATNADKAYTLYDTTHAKPFDVGSTTVPVYFAGGVPVALPKVVAADYTASGTIATAITNLNNTISRLQEQITSLEARIAALESKQS